MKKQVEFRRNDRFTCIALLRELRALITLEVAEEDGKRCNLKMVWFLKMFGLIHLILDPC